MQIESNSSKIVMNPGDRITISVGITHKCDIHADKTGRLSIKQRDKVMVL